MKSKKLIFLFCTPALFYCGFSAFKRTTAIWALLSGPVKNFYQFQLDTIVCTEEKLKLTPSLEKTEELFATLDIGGVIKTSAWRRPSTSRKHQSGRPSTSRKHQSGRRRPWKCQSGRRRPVENVSLVDVDNEKVSLVDAYFYWCFHHARISAS